jgi:hypothetical protein
LVFCRDHSCGVTRWPHACWCVIYRIFLSVFDKSLVMGDVAELRKQKWCVVKTLRVHVSWSLPLEKEIRRDVFFLLSWKFLNFFQYAVLNVRFEK